MAAARMRGWSARDTQKYFDKVFEQVYIEKTPAINPLSHVFLEAAQQAGFSLVPFNVDGTLREGVGIFHLNARNGMRQSSSQAYLHPRLPPRKNLTVLTNTQVNRIVLDENNTASAVETERATIFARREI